MDTFKTITTVLAVRKFKHAPIPQDIVHEIIEAGRLTASSMNGQPWHFVVVQDTNTLQQLGQLAKTGPYIAQAPLAIVVCMLQSRFAVSDCSRAIQDMILTAWSRGVGSNWVGFGNLAVVKPLLGIPDDVDVLAVLPFGYPQEQIGAGIKKRKPLREVASSGHYGTPFA